jgi:hypothetical protein
MPCCVWRVFHQYEDYHLVRFRILPLRNSDFVEIEEKFDWQSMTKLLDLLNRNVKESPGPLEVGIILIETYGLKELLFTADYKRFDPSFGKICAKFIDNLM